MGVEGDVGEEREGGERIWSRVGEGGLRVRRDDKEGV